MSSGKILKKVSGVLLASAVGVTAFGLAPRVPGLAPNLAALADPVRVEAPQAPNFADVVEAVTPAVVSVRVESDLQPSEGSFRFDRRFDDWRLPPFFRDHPFFRDGPWGRPRDDDDRRGYDRDDRDDKRRGWRDRDDDDDRYERRRDRSERRRHDDDRPRRFGMAQGSGFFVSEDGYVVTNHHVVANGSKFTVVLDDGTELDAKLVGADNRTDLAVLKVESDRKFTYVEFDQDTIRVGEWVVAVGNPFGLGGTVTAGIVSAHNRAIRSNAYDDFLQIDAAVNKGNSGGPAFNLNGEVVGINTAIFSPSGGNVGIAFAIPASTAREVVRELIDNGEVVRGWLGVQIQPVTGDIAESVDLDEPAGALVTEPQKDSPADAAGIRPGDVILSVDGEKISDPRHLARKIAGYKPESTVKVDLWRDGRSSTVEVTLGKLTENASATPVRKPAREELSSLGLKLETDSEGVVIVDVEPGSGAAEKGLRPGDGISSVNGEEVSSADEVIRIVREADELGRSAVLFQIMRGGESRFIAVPFDRG